MDMTFDTHGMTVLEAKKQLERMIAQAPDHITAIRVVHGFQHGDAIQKMVRNPNELRSKSIVKRRLTMNAGETIIELLPK